jgi:hypothetical protein
MAADKQTDRETPPPALTPAQRKALIERAQAKLLEPEPVPEEEVGGMLINFETGE